MVVPETAPLRMRRDACDRRASPCAPVRRHPLIALCTTCTRPSLCASHPTRGTLAATALCRHTPAPPDVRASQTTPTHEPALTVKTSLSRMDWRVDCERPIVSRYCINSSACVGASCRSPEPG